jgi:hypothetical protein
MVLSCMDFKKAIHELEQSSDFKEWLPGHKEYFLAHAFVMLDEANKGVWQIGFYSTEKELMETFVLDNGKVSLLPEQEVLKAEGTLKELDRNEVKIATEKALEIAEACRKEKYSKELVAKQFFILQHLDSGTVYNITYFTQSLKTINIKVSAVDGKIVFHNLQELAAFG